MAGRAAEPEVIWARPERTGRGPRPAYSRGDVAAAAVRIADSEGIAALSMRRVAAELGCGTMSLYNYVPRKADLHELMVDEVSGAYDFDAPRSGDWRADMLAVARQTRALMHRHPWLPGMLSGAYAFGPNVLRYLEWCLSGLDGLEAPYGTKMELIAMVNGSVMTFVANELATAERSRSLPWSQEQERAVRGAYLARTLGTGEYPRLAEAMGAAAEPVDADEAFERMTGRVIDAFA
jgi:AcrR family transcriptional regulator